MYRGDPTIKVLCPFTLTLETILDLKTHYIIFLIRCRNKISIPDFIKLLLKLFTVVNNGPVVVHDEVEVVKVEYWSSTCELEALLAEDIF